MPDVTKETVDKMVDENANLMLDTLMQIAKNVAKIKGKTTAAPHVAMAATCAFDLAMKGILTGSCSMPQTEARKLMIDEYRRCVRINAELNREQGGNNEND